jgi:uncharacterized protein (DUF1697 family)
MARRIALLRGINLGSHNRIAMGALREALAGHGYEDVRTLLQSGNVVLSSAARPDRLARELEALIAERFGLDIAVVVRTREELAAVVEHNPLAAVATDPKRHQVVFLRGKPDAEAVRAVEAADVEPERIAIAGREVHVWHANGIQRSPASKLLERTGLGAQGTARNWNTVLKLLELAAA